MSDIVSRPYKPEECCEACVFGKGTHAEWCEKRTFRDAAEEELARAIYEDGLAQ